jgi:hypothetical protein
MVAGVKILGDGVAARTAAWLLGQAGIGTRQEATPRPPLPAILLSGATRNLMRDLFADRQLLRQLPAVTHRQVAWSGQTDPPLLEHHAYATNEVELLEAIPQGKLASIEPPFVLQAQRPLAEGVAEHRFGDRTARLANFRQRTTDRVCQMEATPAGWLFTIPQNEQQGWLIAVGASIESQLAESRLIAKSVDSYAAESGSFASSPRLAWPLTGEGWIACGSAAAAFDPVSGEGTAYALREAILAAAVIKEGASYNAREHYEGRLLAAFGKHLALCRNYYASGPHYDWWAHQTAELDRGLDWCRTTLAAQPEARYRLVDTSLMPL